MDPDAPAAVAALQAVIEQLEALQAQTEIDVRLPLAMLTAQLGQLAGRPAAGAAPRPAGPPAGGLQLTTQGDANIGRDAVGRDQFNITIHYNEKAAAGGPAAPPAEGEIAHNLPARKPVFGREALVQEVLALLAAGQSPVVLEGSRGLGKASLAYFIARRLMERGGLQAVVAWSADHQDHALPDLLDVIGRTLGHNPAASQPTYLDREHARSLLRSIRTLLVITKVTQEKHQPILDFLKTVPAASRVLLATSSPLDFGYHVRVTKLDPVASIEMLRHKAEALVCPYLYKMTDAQLQPLAAACDGLPAALSLSVGLAKKGLRLERILQKLRASQDSFASLWQAAVQSLPEDSREALRVICLSQQSVDGEALQSVLHISAEDLEEVVLRPLLDASLIEEELAETFQASRLAPANRLVGDHVRSSALTEPDHLARLQQQLADYYIAQCQARGGENWAGHGWIAANLREIAGTLAWCAARPDPASQAQVIALVQALYYFLGVRGYWREKLEFGAKALQAAETLGDRASQAQLHVRVIGWTHLQLSQFEPARAHLQRGLELYQQLGDPGGLASSYRYLATLERRGGGEAGRAAAAELYQRALQAADQVADSGRLRASVLISLSTLTVKTGRWAEAEGHLRAALATFRKLGHTSKIAEVLSRLGDLCVLQARLDEAAALFAESQSYAAAITRQKTIAYNLLGLARIAQKRGDYQQMRALALQARQAFGNLAIADESQEIQDLAQMLPAEPA